MAKYFIKRLLIGLVTLFVLSTVTFFLMRIVPGSPFINDDESPAAIRAFEQLQARYHLDKPLFEQYLIYLQGILKGDLGESMLRKGMSVTYIIKRSSLVTARLAVIAFCVSMAAGITLGITAALSKKRWVNNVVMFISTIGVSVPGFLLGVLLLIVFGVKLRWLPTMGLKTPLHYVMPAIALSFHPIAMISRLTRTSMMEVMRQDYIVLARSKGDSMLKVILLHGLKNAMLPVITYAGPMVANMLTGSFVVETLFTVPGIGAEFVTSIGNRDYTLIMGLTIFMGVVVIIMNLISDMAAAVVDPRIRLGK